MKASEKVPSKLKNSFIYFQIGLIATMVIVLIILELNIENKPQEKALFGNPIDLSDPYTPSDFDVKANPKEVIVKKILQKTQTQKVSDKIEVKPDDVKIVRDTKLADEGIEANTDVKETSASNNNNNANSPNPSDNNLVKNIFSIENFPQFEACKGVSKSQQKQCFDEQLFKAVLKNLEYPSVDVANNKEGTVFLEFIISNTGQITNVSAVSNNRSTELMKINAIKALQKVPRMKPAQQGSENVAVKYALPLSFKITK